MKGEHSIFYPFLNDNIFYVVQNEDTPWANVFKYLVVTQWGVYPLMLSGHEHEGGLIPLH